LKILTDIEKLECMSIFMTKIPTIEFENLNIYFKIRVVDGISR
jgi:hypothetical protein